MKFLSSSKSSAPVPGWRGLLGCLALLFASGSPVRATTFVKQSMTEIIDKSENVFIAVCESKTCEVRNHNIVTTYKLRPSEFLKGEIKTDASGTISMQELGGAITQPIALSQIIVGSTPLVSGEEVLLFTRPSKAVEKLASQGLPPESALLAPETPILVDWVNGRFSVLTDADSGEKFVVRTNSFTIGPTSGDAAVYKHLNRSVKGLKQAVTLQRARKPTRLDATDPAAIRDYDSLDQVRARVKNYIQTSAPKTK